MQARLVVVLLCLVACGGPGVGDRCDVFGSAACDPSHTKGALFCEGGVFVAYDCPGLNGCTMSSSRVVCDFHGVSAGAACPAGQIDKAFCNNNVFFKCARVASGQQPGQWSTMNCTSCSDDGATVTCH